MYTRAHLLTSHFNVKMSFSNETILAVWAKGKIIFGYDSSIQRNDKYGNTIIFQEYGNRNSSRGWEIHHIVSKASGGPDDLSNLAPLQWEKNVILGG